MFAQIGRCNRIQHPVDRLSQLRPQPVGGAAVSPIAVRLLPTIDVEHRIEDLVHRAEHITGPDLPRIAGKQVPPAPARSPFQG
jgi:hypothetical protein